MGIFAHSISYNSLIIIHILRTAALAAGQFRLFERRVKPLFLLQQIKSVKLFSERIRIM